jgi:TolA-binding protein
MVLSVFKSGDELFNQGVDLIKRKEYAKAKKNFEKTIEKGGREAGLAKVYIDIIDASFDRDNPARYNKLAATLSNTKDGFVFGLTEADPERLAAECRLRAERLTIGNMPGNNQAALEEKGNKYLEVARKYQAQIGNDNITISELVGVQVNTGIREALYIQAWGFESLASGAVMSDPKKAAEMLQNAYACRKQLGEDGQQTMNQIKAYSKSVKCWICGRPATGEGVHFLTMSSDVSPFMRKSGDEILQSAPADYNSVYVCRPCYSSISRRSDEIARQYHDRAMQEMRAMEARLQAEIRSMYAAISIRR